MSSPESIDPLDLHLGPDHIFRPWQQEHKILRQQQNYPFVLYPAKVLNYVASHEMTDLSAYDNCHERRRYSVSSYDSLTTDRVEILVSMEAMLLSPRNCSKTRLSVKLKFVVQCARMAVNGQTQSHFEFHQPM